MPESLSKEIVYKTPLLDPNNLPEGYYIDKQGCIRDNKMHQIQRGGAALNNKGRQKNSTFIGKLNKKFKHDDIIVDQLYKMITYDHDKDMVINSKGKSVRVHYPRVKETDKLAAIKLVLAYVYGRPHTNITIDKTVDIKIEAKMHQVAELIHQNRDRLQIIQGGKEEEVIDVEPVENDDIVEDIIKDEVNDG